MVSPLELTGLRPVPAQTFGAFRLIPLLRETPCEDVRLSRAVISPGLKIVDLPGRKSYIAFVPHGLRLTWGSAAGTQVHEKAGLPRSAAPGPLLCGVPGTRFPW